MNPIAALIKSMPVLSIALFLSLISCNKRAGKPKILVFSKTAGYHHESIPDGIAAIQKLGSNNNFEVDTTTNAAWFNTDSLEKYAAVVFLSTTGDLLNHYQEAELERYIQAGGGFAGIHAASDAEYNWSWYGRLVGAYYDSHPEQQQAVLHVADAGHPSTKHLPKEWKRKDEWYNFKKISSDIKVLLTIDENSYKGGKNGTSHPMAWYHDFDGGRSFYTELGHTKESFSEELFLNHLLGGIQYAIGENKELDYSKATTLPVPIEDRFKKTTLTMGTLFEPTEMTILPNLDVLIAQRRGEIMLYKKETDSIKQAGFLNVYWKSNTPGVNAEEGVLGLKADPNFKNNHFVYIFYSPADTSVNRLSRFTFENDTINPKSEKIVLQFYSQRDICCHTGGSIAFDSKGDLFLSTGDNSTPFNEKGQPYVNNGFAPLDQRIDHEQYDARRTSGNTNDLRGKILRIRVKDDGSYEIPEGNLYPKGLAKTKPEIYIQGNRNPYRISVDQQNGFLYWGEVGPDANFDSLDVRGPRGYDEINQARKAGYYGWPLFVGNNYPYHEYNYQSGTAGTAFNPAKPINNSRNNTGLMELPPAQPAFIWYPYAESPEFPQMGTGGRNAMAGPVYYTGLFPKETRLPDYYNKKLFIYDWVRGWIKVVTLQPNGDFDKMEPFMEHTKLNALIDMEVGPDGKLYLLEYGNGWFSKNPDAGLSRIDYSAGNLAPKIADFQVEKTSGILPFQLVATVNATDPEKEQLTYIWDLGNGEKKQTSAPRLEHIYKQAGSYLVSVTAIDDKKDSTKSKPIEVYAGNEAPVVHITLPGNKTLYFPGKPVAYSVTIQDNDDTSKVKDLSTLFVSTDYSEASDKVATSQGHQVMTEAMAGKSLMQSLDCKTCHKAEEKSIGPAFNEVSKRYQKDPKAESYLVNKIIKGGSGVWGDVAMPAHPALKETDARQIVAWVLSLAGGGQTQKSLPANGKIAPAVFTPVLDNGLLYISASYTDKGGVNSKPLTASQTLSLRNSRIHFLTGVDNIKGFVLVKFDDNKKYMLAPKGTGSFSLNRLDLSEISSAELQTGWMQPSQFGYTFELRLDAPDGKKIGEFLLPGTGQVTGKKGTSLLKSKIEPVTDGGLHDLFIVSQAKSTEEPNQVGLQYIELVPKK